MSDHDPESEDRRATALELAVQIVVRLDGDPSAWTHPIADMALSIAKRFETYIRDGTTRLRKA